jgi:AcrR family transcriptional regulator
MNQVSTPLHTNSRKRPGGRTADVTDRVHRAIMELLAEGGVGACTFSAVAERAGTERSTLYRRFPDRWEAILDAFMAYGQAALVPDDTGSFAGDLRSVLEKLAAILKTPLGSAVVSGAAEIQRLGKQDLIRTNFARRMTQLDPMFDRAIARGELRAEVERELVFTTAAGPLYFCSFISARGVDDALLSAVVSNVCWLYCSPSVAAKLSLPARIA